MYEVILLVSRLFACKEVNLIKIYLESETVLKVKVPLLGFKFVSIIFHGRIKYQYSTSQQVIWSSLCLDSRDTVCMYLIFS